MKRFLIVVVLILSICLAFVGCDKESAFVNPGDSLGGGGTGVVPTKVSSTHDTILEGKDFSLASESSNTDLTGVETLVGNGITCTSDCSYILTGSYGALTINAKKGNTVHLFLNNASISSLQSSAIIKSDKQINLILTCVAGTTNTISNNFEGANTIHVKGSLTINGSGNLSVLASANDSSAIKVSKAFKVVDANLTISSTKHGITAEEITAENCTINVTTSGKDGLNAECDFDNDEGTTYEFTTDSGFVYLKNVNYTASTSGDGIQADSFIVLDGGTYNITTNGVFVSKTTANKSTYGLTDDDFKYIKQGSEYVRVATDYMGSSVKYAYTQSCNGLKVGKIEYDTNGDDIEDAIISTGDYFIQILSGTININSSDDAIHTNSGNLYIDGGTITVNTKDDALTCDNLLLISAGSISVESCFEGLEGACVEINGGDISIVSSDDGINAASDEKNAEMHIIISAGRVVINATGDGIDSNGSLLISGGEVYVFGPTSGADAGLDSEKGIVVNGGTVFASSTLGMVETPSNNSSNYILSFAQNQSIASGTNITIKDSEDNIIMQITLVKSCQSLIVSLPEFEKGKTYSIYGGDSLLSSFTISSQITTIGSSNNMNRPGGNPGGNMGGGIFNPGRR